MVRVSRRCDAGRDRRGGGRCGRVGRSGSSSERERTLLASAALNRSDVDDGHSSNAPAARRANATAYDSPKKIAHRDVSPVGKGGPDRECLVPFSAYSGRVDATQVGMGNRESGMGNRRCMVIRTNFNMSILTLVAEPDFAVDAGRSHSPCLSPIPNPAVDVPFPRIL